MLGVLLLLACAEEAYVVDASPDWEEGPPLRMCLARGGHWLDVGYDDELVIHGRVVSDRIEPISIDGVDPEQVPCVLPDGSRVLAIDGDLGERWYLGTEWDRSVVLEEGERVTVRFAWGFEGFGVAAEAVAIESAGRLLFAASNNSSATTSTPYLEVEKGEGEGPVYDYGWCTFLQAADLTATADGETCSAWHGDTCDLGDLRLHALNVTVLLSECGIDGPDDWTRWVVEPID